MESNGDGHHAENEAEDVGTCRAASTIWTAVFQRGRKPHTSNRSRRLPHVTMFGGEWPMECEFECDALDPTADACHGVPSSLRLPRRLEGVHKK